MNHSESGRSSWSDQELDALLYDFFRRELPEELRDLPSHSEAPPGTSSPKRREQAVLAPVIGLMAVAASLLLALSAFWSFPVNRNPESSHGLAGAGMPTAGDVTARSGREAAPYEGTPAPMEQLVIERYETDTGPVEQRTNIHWKTMPVFEPDSGTEVEIMIPEVKIEVFEIDDDE